jgi:hypothetical protein
MRPAGSRDLLALPVLALIAGCARHVVIDPELVPSHNDRDWTVHHEPAAPAAAASTGGRDLPSKVGEAQ